MKDLKKSNRAATDHEQERKEKPYWNKLKKKVFDGIKKRRLENEK